MPIFPRNPYLKRKDINRYTKEMSDEEWEIESRMQEVQYAQSIPGNFAYLPILETREDGSLHITGYDLIVFGEKSKKQTVQTSNPNKGYPILLMLSSGQDLKRATPPDPNAEH